MCGDINYQSSNIIYRITLRPIRLLMFMIGALPYEFKHEQKCSWFKLIWRLIHFTLLAIFLVWISVLRFLSFHEVLYKENDVFSISMDMISYSSLIIIHVIIYWENTWKAWRYKEIFDNFELLRRKFKCEFQRSIDLGRIRLYAVLLYALLAVYMIIVLFIIFIRYIKSLNGFRLILLQYGDTILKLKLIEFSIFGAIVVVFEMELNCFLVHYIKEIRRCQFADWPVKRKLVEKLYILQDLHNILIVNVRYIEEYCCWSLPGLFLKMFFEFIITAYWIYFSYDFNIPAIFQSYGCSVNTLNLIILFVICSIGSKCEMLDKQLANTLHMIKYDRHDPFLNACLNEISLQTLHEKLYFTAGGFVDVNYSFLGKYIFSAICYIVILIQFHMSV
ncbi:putative gustatory receptor 98a [Lucilia cuprina]|uniref:putative gustatory receptor 98a n=1 Tax=Lucilia cuprina TaxID=7375 RepID=UPI001F065095|nr:putative gustatory receptor 98a [Lucilia cuprina]